ncbi:MAG: hypothetical protein HC930_10185 [Hydrococcus sp. SU_1_0]|nr:hypothetical protein [Hydrococcus sp. SU_1_0]
MLHSLGTYILEYPEAVTSPDTNSTSMVRASKPLDLELPAPRHLSRTAP